MRTIAAIARITALVLACGLLAACAVNPVTGERELSLISPQQEIAIGSQQYGPARQAQGGRYYIDPAVEDYVAEVGQKLAAVSHQPQLPYEFAVIDNPVPNAWALPGGKIALNTGLLLHLEDESQLAAVLAHEIVHAAARHGAGQVSRSTVLGIGAQVATIAAQSAGPEIGALGELASQLGAAAWMASYGRGHELEADRYGMEYMSELGYDLDGAVELQETFVRLNEDRQQDFISGLFASHPPSRERVARNREMAARLPDGNIRNRDRYQNEIAQLKRDEPAYEARQKAIEALNNKEAKAALAHLDKAVEIQPDDGHSWELRGHAWAMLDNPANADKAFSTALRKNDDYFSHHLARGILRYRQGQEEEAVTDLENSRLLLPTAVASYYLGEVASARGDTAEALAYYNEAAQGGGEVGKRAHRKQVAIELPHAPEKYLATGVYVGSDGYLQVAVQNRSGIAVAGVAIRLSERIGPRQLGNSTVLRGPDQLAAGEHTVFATRIGPFTSAEAAGRFHVQVVAARPADQDR